MRITWWHWRKSNLSPSACLWEVKINCLWRLLWKTCFSLLPIIFPQLILPGTFDSESGFWYITRIMHYCIPWWKNILKSLLLIVLHRFCSFFILQRKTIWSALNVENLMQGRFPYNTYINLRSLFLLNRKVFFLTAH